MRPFLERIDSSSASSFAYRVFRPRSFPFQWHFHPEIELTLIGRGRGRRFVGNDISPFVPGDLVLLGSNLPHSWMSAQRDGKGYTGVESVVIQFRPEFLGEHFFEHAAEMSRIKTLLARAARGIQFTGAARQRAASALRIMRDAPPLRRLTLLLETLDDLARCRTARLLSSHTFDSGFTRAEQTRIQEIYAYAHTNYTAPIRLSEIAAVVHRSPSAFARFFRRMSGRSFTEYINALRIDRACELLRDEEGKVAAVALAAGFANLSYFNRMFRRLKGMRPTEFRQAYRRDSIAKESSITSARPQRRITRIGNGRCHPFEQL